MAAGLVISADMPMRTRSFEELMIPLVHIPVILIGNGIHGQLGIGLIANGITLVITVGITRRGAKIGTVIDTESSMIVMVHNPPSYVSLSIAKVCGWVNVGPFQMCDVGGQM